MSKGFTLTTATGPQAGQAAQQPAEVVPAAAPAVPEQTAPEPTPTPEPPAPSKRKAPSAPSAGPGATNEARPVSVPPAPPVLDLTDLLAPLTKAAGNAALEYAAARRRLAEKDQGLSRALAAVRQAGGSTGDVELLLMKAGVNPNDLPEHLLTYTWD